MQDDVFTVFIAEDEQPARDLLLDYIFKREELKMEGWSKEGEETYSKLCEKKYDLISRYQYAENVGHRSS
jgi:hypothetical protein